MPIGVKVEYKSLESFPYYGDCAPLVEALGYFLVDLRVVNQKQSVRISAVIAAKNPAAEIGVDDCSKVHHALLPRLEALLGTDDTYMELTSPGMERTIKNAAEFVFFIGRDVRVWDKNAADWRSGKIVGADESSVRLEIDGKEETFLFENIAKAKFNNR
ncbi:MAG: ribosome maturation factor [Treponema sp.]